MSLPYHRYQAVAAQRGHQLFYDQVLAGVSNTNSGSFLADGSIMTSGPNCTITVNDTFYLNNTDTAPYNMPNPCSTWAGVTNSANVCCANNDTSVQVAPVMVFPISLDEELSAVFGKNC